MPTVLQNLLMPLTVTQLNRLKTNLHFAARQKFEGLHHSERDAHPLRIALAPRQRDQTLDAVRIIEGKV